MRISLKINNNLFVFNVSDKYELLEELSSYKSSNYLDIINKYCVVGKETLLHTRLGHKYVKSITNGLVKECNPVKLYKETKEKVESHSSLYNKEFMIAQIALKFTGVDVFQAQKASLKDLHKWYCISTLVDKDKK